MDIQAIGECLGVFGITSGERVSFRLINRSNGVVLRLEVTPTVGKVRLFVDLGHKKSGARFIGMVTIERVETVEDLPVQGEVIFHNQHTTLTIDSGGRFEVAVS